MPTADLKRVSLEKLDAAVERAKRKSTVAFPVSFVVARPGTARSPLGRMIHGGRGGKVRLMLYMTITLLATRAPFDIRNVPTPRSWAELLALSPDTGPRTISRSLSWLARNRFISLTDRAGAMPVITLLDPSGDGSQYVRPAEAGRYVRVPPSLWRNGWIVDLSATGLALLLVLLENEAGRDEQANYVTRQRKDTYTLSPDTWTRARKELESQEILVVGRVPQGSDYDFKRLRNTYRVNLARLESLPKV